MIADDAATVRQQLTSMLSIEGFDLVVVAKNGNEAVAHAEAAQFDLIIMDINMPRMDGLEAGKLIRSMPNYVLTPMFALTAEASTSLIKRGKEIGFTGWFVKPFRNHTMLKAIRETLGIREVA